MEPIPATARSKAWDSGLSIPGIVGSNPAGEMDICVLRMLSSVKVEVPMRGLSLVQGSPTGCGVSECDI